MRIKMALLSTVLGLAQIGSASAFELEAMTDAERTLFRQEIRNYLLENPEVIFEAVDVMEARKAQAQAAGDLDLVTANAEDLFADPQSWAGGNLDGDLVLVEFVDYKCGYCKRAHAEVSELIETDGNIKLILKEFPILGAQSEMASRFAIAVLQSSDADTYKKVQDTLITYNGDITEEMLRGVATDNSLNADAIIEAMGTDPVTAVIKSNRELAQRMQINGTPTFVMGTEMLRGYVPLDGMRELAADIRQNAG